MWFICESHQDVILLLDKPNDIRDVKRYLMAINLHETFMENNNYSKIEMFFFLYVSYAFDYKIKFYSAMQLLVLIWFWSRKCGVFINLQWDRNKTPNNNKVKLMSNHGRQQKVYASHLMVALQLIELSVQTQVISSVSLLATWTVKSSLG